MENSVAKYMNNSLESFSGCQTSGLSRNFFFFKFLHMEREKKSEADTSTLTSKPWDVVGRSGEPCPTSLEG